MRPRNRPPTEAVAVREMAKPTGSELWYLKDGSVFEVEAVISTEGKPDVFRGKLVTPADKDTPAGSEFDCDLEDFKTRIGEAPPKPEAAPTKKGKAAKTKAVQTKLPGIQHPEDAELEGEVTEYVETRNNRMALNKTEKELNNKLLARLKAMGKTELAVDGHIVKIVAKDERVKVVTNKDEDGEEGEEDSDD